MAQQGIRVKDLEQYTGDLNRNDLSLPLDANDFITAKRITGQQLKAIIEANFNEIEQQFQDLKQGLDDAQVVINTLMEGTWVNEW